MKDQNNRANQYSQRESLVLLEPYLEPASIVEFLKHFNTLLPWIVAQWRIWMYGNQPVQRIVRLYILSEVS